MILFLIPVNRKQIVVDVDPHCLVSELKHLLNDLEGIPVKLQRICFNGKQLDDSQSLNSQMVFQESIVFVSLRVSGGRILSQYLKFQDKYFSVAGFNIYTFTLSSNSDKFVVGHSYGGMIIYGIEDGSTEQQWTVSGIPIKPGFVIIRDTTPGSAAGGGIHGGLMSLTFSTNLTGLVAEGFSFHGEQLRSRASFNAGSGVTLTYYNQERKMATAFKRHWTSFGSRAAQGTVYLWKNYRMRR